MHIDVDQDKREAPIESTEDLADVAQTGEDLTGRDRLVWNVLTSWGGYLVFIAAGFIMPRLVDRMIGQTSLGIWDFCWSLVSYISLMGLGVGSSVNRYVALYRAKGDIEGLSRSVSTVAVIQVLIGVAVMAVTAILVWLLPVFFADRLGEDVSSARWVIGLLGTSLAVEMFLNPSRGVITGCHRWGLHNGINAASRAMDAVGMLIVLLLGGGLQGMGWVHLVTVLSMETYRTAMSFRVCPELRIRLDHIGRSEARDMIVFGGKTIISDLPPLVLVQTASLVVVGTLGPAALAVFSRPVALIRHVQTIINKFAFVLVPTAGSLHGSGRREGLRQLMIEMTRYSMIFTIPMIATLAVFGDMILRLWMGEKYANGMLMAVLALGYFLPVAQNSVLRILVGMNMHGRAGLWSLLSGGVIFGAGCLFLYAMGWDLERIAVILGLSLMVGGGIIIPVLACRIMEIPLGEYISRVFVGPLVCNMAYVAVLLIFKYWLIDYPWRAFGWGAGVGGILLSATYWRFLLSDGQRGRVRRYLSARLGRFYRESRAAE